MKLWRIKERKRNQSMAKKSKASPAVYQKKIKDLQVPHASWAPKNIEMNHDRFSLIFSYFSNNFMCFSYLNNSRTISIDMIEYDNRKRRL